MTLNKDNEPINPKNGKKLKTKHSNVPAIIITTIIVGLLVVGGVMFASEKLSDYITNQFVVVSSVNLN